MKKYTIIGVIVLMSISLLGVVGLQLYWINDAIHVKQAQFDHAVNEALTNAVEKLETQEAVSVVTDKMAALRHPLVADSIVTPPAKQKQISIPATKRRKPLKTNTSQKAPEKSTIKGNVVWLQDPSIQQGKIIAGKNGQTWFKLVNGDTIPLNEQQIISLNPIKYIDVQQNARTADGARLQVYSDQKEAAKIIRKNTAYNIERLPDSLITFYKTRNKTFSFSVDTLRLLATKLDSVHQFTRLSSNIKSAEYTSVEVRNDSILLYHKGKTKPVYLSYANSSHPSAVKLYSQVTGDVGLHVRNINPSLLPLAEKRGKSTNAKHLIKDASVFHELILTPAEPIKSKEQQVIAKLAPVKKTTTEKLEHKKEKLNDVVQKMVVEYVAKDEPLQNRINLKNLHNLLQEELEKQGINLPFGYWVVSSKKDTLTANNVAAYTDLSLRKYKASLFPNDIFDKSDYLDLYFPDSKSYALKSLWGMLALSGFFTLVIIATFGTTIHIIYKQKKLSEMKNDFINNMTHEFKTPIATISLATDSIANPKVYENPDKIKYYTNIIRQENKRMNTQVENVLQIALLEKNEFKMKLEPVDVHLLIVKAIESIRLQVEQRLGQINVQLDALKHELKSDEVHLYNVICNLLDNANKYSPASPEISLSTRNVEGGILIAVEDNGMGMSKDTQHRVFEKFYRVPTGNLHNVKGFGLGLSYVKAIVQAHHGNISLWSEPGKGSRFEIFLPIRNS